MKKEIFKSIIAILTVNIITYCVYLILLLSGLIQYYELSEMYTENLPVSIFYFAFSLIVILLISSSKKKSRLYNILFLAEMLILGILSMIFSFHLLNINCFGIYDVLQYFCYIILEIKIDITVLLKCISPVLSSAFYYLVLKVGDKISISMHRSKNFQVKKQPTED